MSRRESSEAPEGVGTPPEQRTRALVFGEVLFDHFEGNRKVLGGAPFNVAWHLCGFGGDPFLVSQVGDDPDGREILDQMESWGLTTAAVDMDPDHPTGSVLVSTEEGDTSFEIPEDQAWDHMGSASSWRDIPLDTVGIIYHGSLAVRTEEAWRSLQEIIEASGAPTFVDLNLRPPWWTPERVRWCLDTARWAKLNTDELAQVTGRSTDSPEKLTEAARQLRAEHDLAILFVTGGAEGSMLVTEEGEVLHHEADRVGDIVDTVGAGDAFSALACQGLLHGWTPEQLLDRASAFAAEACRFRGATATDLSVYEGHLRRWVDGSHPPSHLGAEAQRPLYILSLSVHGLVRGEDIELGRDSDTGGQIAYVVDQAMALARHPRVGRVDLVTRRVEDRRVDDAYKKPVESLSENARIVRLPFGPRRYLRKESLWPHLDSLLDELTRFIRREGRVPDLIHSHYADAGYVGAQLSKLLGIPLVFTGHSLGRVKRERLLADGDDEESLEERYHLTTRIEAEEQALEAAALVIASTHQEVHEQYEGYDHYEPDRMEVNPPGVDLTRFSPPSRFWLQPAIAREVDRFLANPDKPMILALARPDHRKNFQGLIRAYAETPGLRDAANLVLIAGNRNDISEMDPAPRRVLNQILLLVDRYDLYGSVAYPKHHNRSDVPDLYRLAARSRGIFVNPALTEPFGLTLIEAAATGLPVVATEDGGPRDILEACGHGMLADPLDPEELGQAMLESITDRRRWALWSKSAVSHVHEKFSWNSHVRRYIEEVEKILAGERPTPAIHPVPVRLPHMNRILLTDVDDTLTGDDEALEALRERLHDGPEGLGFGIATGRSLQRALEILDELGQPVPDLLITASGTALHYGSRLILDRSWERQIRYRWEPERVLRTLQDLTGVHLEEDAEQTHYRLRYLLDGEAPALLDDVRRHLRKAGVQATPILDHERHIDVVPSRASPGLAIRFLCFKWNISPDRLLVAGDSGNDADMLSGDTLGVVVGNHTPELDHLRGRPRIYFAEGEHAWGVVEGMEHYDFLGSIRIPDEDIDE